MAEREIKVKIQNARDVKSNWERNNPVLLDGEIGVVYDATDDPNQPRLKVGDGTTDYKNLPYFEDPTKIDKAQMGLPNGVASLDKHGIIPLSQLPDIIGGTGDSTTYIEKIPEQLGKLVYTGESLMPVWRYYDMEAFIIGGTISAVDAGTYTTTFQPAEGYAWSDGSRAPVYCQWAIQRQVIEVEPTIEDFELTFNGEAQSPIIVDCDLDAFVMSGQIEATTVGDYTIILTPDKNHCWSDGSWDALTLSWSIVPCVRVLPELEGEYTYNGASQSPTWKNYPAAGVSATGETSAINAGTYTVTFQLEDGYVWAGDTN